MAAPRALRGAAVSRGSVDPAATIRRHRGVNDAAYRFCNHRHVVPGNLEQTEAKLKAPVAPARKLEPADEGLDRGFARGAPVDVTAERTKAAAHIRLIRRGIFCNADGRKRLQPVFAAEHAGWRVVDNPVTRLDALERRGLAVTHLHESVASADTNMFGRGHRHPVPAHAAAGVNTRSR
jgi:hypothetical protein